jgi:hypothetical protein
MTYYCAARCKAGETTCMAEDGNSDVCVCPSVTQRCGWLLFSPNHSTPPAALAPYPSSSPDSSLLSQHVGDFIPFHPLNQQRQGLPRAARNGHIAYRGSSIGHPNPSRAGLGKSKTHKSQANMISRASGAAPASMHAVQKGSA